jgi:hypothetical protein
VTVTTVVPGLMRTGSHLQARFTGQAGKEFTWFALGASLPLISMDAERAARQIIAAVRRRQPEIILTPAGQIVSRVAGLAPGLTSEILHLVQRLMLPAPAGASPAAEGDGPRGQDLDPAFSRKVFDRLTVLGRAAASRFNERLQLIFTTSAAPPDVQRSYSLHANASITKPGDFDSFTTRSSRSPPGSWNSSSSRAPRDHPPRFGRLIVCRGPGYG